ncbi:MAG: PD-(D/E)XK nuclease family protein [Chloroflexi bacterium]|nr:PD-(D/E)XK nuclease family protein [Chloroflexota bacterium]
MRKHSQILKSDEPMTLPTDFQFSQASLQDYVDCPRRFQLRYVERVAWPAHEAEPALENERYMQQGAAFHRLVHRHMLGIPQKDLLRMVNDADLSRWWQNYSKTGFVLSPFRYPEVLLSAPISGYRLAAKYDLVTVDPGQWAVIVDWKTSRKRTSRKWLTGRLQTRVYAYVLARAGHHLNDGQSFEPEQIEMIYWFANFPDNPERFIYDAAQYDADEVYLTSRIDEIKNLGDHEWPLTIEERHCDYCPYRSLCQRGVKAGPFDEIEEASEPDDDFDISLDLEQIAEIEY